MTLILDIHRLRIGVHISARSQALTTNDTHDLPRRFKMDVLSTPRVTGGALNGASGIDITQRQHGLTHFAGLFALPEIRKLAPISSLREQSQDVAHPVFDQFAVVLAMGGASRMAGAPALQPNRFERKGGRCPDGAWVAARVAVRPGFHRSRRSEGSSITFVAGGHAEDFLFDDSAQIGLKDAGHGAPDGAL